MNIFFRIYTIHLLFEKSRLILILIFLKVYQKLIKNELFYK